MVAGSDGQVAASPVSVSAWAQLRDATGDPSSCDPSEAALVAAAVLADVRAVRDQHGHELMDSAAGTSTRQLANTLNSIERLALAAQRLGVEALTARLRYDLAGVEQRSADMYWHLSEAADILGTVADLRVQVVAEADRPQPEVADVLELGGEQSSEIVVDLRDDALGVEDPLARPSPALDRPGPAGAKGRIVAAAMGVEPDIAPATTAPPEAYEGTEPATVDAVPEDEDEPTWPAWQHPARTGEWTPPVFVLQAEPRRVLPGRIESIRARRREVRHERAMIREDDRSRGARPRIPTWLAQGAATLLATALLALVVVGAVMLIGSDVGPF